MVQLNGNGNDLGGNSLVSWHSLPSAYRQTSTLIKSVTGYCTQAFTHQVETMQWKAKKKMKWCEVAAQKGKIKKPCGAPFLKTSLGDTGKYPLPQLPLGGPAHIYFLIQTHYCFHSYPQSTHTRCLWLYDAVQVLIFQYDCVFC